MFDSISYITMRTALDGSSMRQRIIADDVTNIQTPSFLADKVRLEDKLARVTRFNNP